MIMISIRYNAFRLYTNNLSFQDCLKWISGKIKIQHKKTATIGDAKLESIIVNLAFGIDIKFEDNDWIDEQVLKVR